MYLANVSAEQIYTCPHTELQIKKRKSCARVISCPACPKEGSGGGP